jgi:peptidoglycan/LPS O-acetylase OafA/YrhL
VNADWKFELGVSSPMDAGWWIVRMDLGVKVFFTISGFILSLPFLRSCLTDSKQVNLKEYFIRRLLRLEPPFVITLIGFYVVQVLVMNTGFLDLLPNFLASLVYAHSFIYGRPSVINPVTWSLETEAQFYILIPFLIGFIFMPRYRAISLFLVLLFFVAGLIFKSLILANGPENLSYSILVYLSNFLLGLVIAFLFLKTKLFNGEKHYLFDILGLLGTLGLFYFYKPQVLWTNNLFFNLSALMLFIGTFRGKIHNWFYTLKPIYIIGGMCYTIYLLHFAFFHFLIRMTSGISLGNGYGTDLILQFLVCTPLLLVPCAIFFLLVEKPCMDRYWPSKLLAMLRIVSIKKV